ncbi:ribonuclease H-like [Ambystoma mexicanum]|uniref:ribonuclease H-like n=1 Tax=Ambystoma mexicanum TaxID=8296 RepID=UPI0037E8F4C3
MDSPLGQVEDIFFDDSATIDQETGERHTGTAVVLLEAEGYEILIMKRLPMHYLAQAAKLISLIEALHMSQGCHVTIYSDSAYVTTTVHAGLLRWKRRGYRRVDGSTVQHAALLDTLIFALSQPSLVPVVKCAAHTNNTDEISLGSDAADAMAKMAAYLPVPTPAAYIVTTPPNNQQNTPYTAVHFAHLIELQSKRQMKKRDYG